MNKRTLLATATLTALLLTAGSMPTTPTDVEAELAPHALGVQTLQSVEAPTGPQWGAAWGLDFGWNVFTVLACAAFTGPGAIACGIAGAA